MAGSTRNLMAVDLPSVESQEMIGSKGLIKKTELVKVIVASLNSLGYKKTAALVEKESGIPLHLSIVESLLKQVRDENWEGSVAALRQIDLLDETVVKSASLLLIEQKFFELLSEKRDMDAMHYLQNEITPLCTTGECDVYAFCLLSLAQCRRLGFYNEDTGFTAYRSKTLERLLKVLPPEVIIPEKRLVGLVEQALERQVYLCNFHNCRATELSLYSDHICGRSRVPSQTLQTLQAHTDEVWSLQFSHDGKYLASGSKDKSGAIWEVKENGQLLLKHRLHGHQQPVSAIEWSPDDGQLLTCGLGEVIRRWDVDSGECLDYYEKYGFRLPGIGMSGINVLSCLWHPTDEIIYGGMTDKTICVWNLNDSEAELFSLLDFELAIGISDMAIVHNGRKIITRSDENRISWMDTVTNEFELLITEEDVITSFSVSKWEHDDYLLLVNLLNQQSRIWSLTGSIATILTSIGGYKRERLLIRSCFGGFRENFIASGSEDSQVYIWDRHTGELISALPGHSGSVNCVAWNPVNLDMLASASDDHTIRIWGSSTFYPKLNDC